MRPIGARIPRFGPPDAKTAGLNRSFRCFYNEIRRQTRRLPVSMECGLHRNPFRCQWTRQNCTETRFSATGVRTAPKPASRPRRVCHFIHESPVAPCKGSGVLVLLGPCRSHRNVTFRDHGASAGWARPPRFDGILAFVVCLAAPLPVISRRPLWTARTLVAPMDGPCGMSWGRSPTS